MKDYKKNLPTITLLDICVTPSLKDGWISGITDENKKKNFFLF